MSILDVKSDETVNETDGVAIDLNWLISVDDHILEPPNLWVDRVASKDRDRAPNMQVDDNGMDVWVYDGKKMPELGIECRRWQVQGGVQPRAAELLGDAARMLRRQGAGRGHEPLRCACVAVLSDAAPVLRAAVHGGQRPRVRLPVPPDLQRLARRGMVRCRPGALHPADADPHVGSAAGRQGNGTHGRQGRDLLRVLRKPGTLGAAHDSRRRPLLGTRHGCGQRSRSGGEHARRLVLDAAQDLRRRTIHGESHLGCLAHVGNDAVLVVQRALPALPEPEDRLVGG